MPGRVWEPDNRATPPRCSCVYRYDPAAPDGPFVVDVLDWACPAAEVHARTATITKGHR